MNMESRESQNAPEMYGPALVKTPCPILDAILGLAGAAAGGIAGYFLFIAIANQGFYALALPGALMGIGCGALSGRKSNCLAVICAVLALIAGFLIEWRFAPFIADDTLSYFLTHLHQLNRVTQILIVLGAVLAFYFARGRKGGTWLRKQNPSREESNTP